MVSGLPNCGHGGEMKSKGILQVTSDVARESESQTLIHDRPTLRSLALFIAAVPWQPGDDHFGTRSLRLRKETLERIQFIGQVGVGRSSTLSFSLLPHPRDSLKDADQQRVV